MDLSTLSNQIQYNKKIEYLSDFLKIDIQILSTIYLYIPNIILDKSNLSIIQNTNYTFTSSNNKTVLLNDLSRFLKQKIQHTNLYPENIESYEYLGSLSIFNQTYNLFSYKHKRMGAQVNNNLICNIMLLHHEMD
jgi:hypothetical protein